MYEWETFVEEHSEELYKLAKEIARIPAPLNGESRRAAFCLQWLKEQGAADAYIDAAGNVIWYSPSVVSENGQNEKMTLYIAHMDVVFPDTEDLPWNEENGKIYCPGVMDDTANLAVLLMCAKYRLSVKNDSKVPELFVCSVGEEGLGNLKGVREICRRFADQIESVIAFDLTMDSYTAKAVGSLRYEIEITTPGGHSFLNFGSPNANALLAKLISCIYELQVPENGHTTYNVGTVSGGTSVNTIAQSAEMLCEVRSDEAVGLADMRKKLEDLFAVYKQSLPEKCQMSVRLIGDRPCEKSVDTEKRRKLFERVESAAEYACGKKPQPVSCSTDCNIPLSMGIPSVCIGTCRGAGAHTREEYIEKASLKDGLRLALHLCARSRAGGECTLYYKDEKGAVNTGWKRAE